MKANGRPFLRELYRRISEDPELEAVTVSEALGAIRGAAARAAFFQGRGSTRISISGSARRKTIRPGSCCWTRGGPTTASAAASPKTMRELAYEELLIAEGSDWCWWYGPEHGSDNRPEFDQLYRDHLSNVYRALGEEPPAHLSRPILTGAAGRVSRAAVESDSRDARRRSDFVLSSGWARGAIGPIRAPARCMRVSLRCARFSTAAMRRDLFVRVDGSKSAKFGIETEHGAAVVRRATGRIIEMQTPISCKRFRVTVARDGLPETTVPKEGWIEITPGA